MNLPHIRTLKKGVLPLYYPGGGGSRGTIHTSKPGEAALSSGVLGKGEVFPFAPSLGKKGREKV